MSFSSQDALFHGQLSWLEVRSRAKGDRRDQPRPVTAKAKEMSAASGLPARIEARFMGPSWWKVEWVGERSPVGVVKPDSFDAGRMCITHPDTTSVKLVAQQHCNATKGSMSSIKRNNVKVSGQGSRTIMFAHGYGCDQAMWRAVAPSFERDYKVIVFDYVGSGHSDGSAFNRTRYSTLNGYAADVIEIIDELGVGKVNFVAHSVSSMIGAVAAIERPELFESLVMIGPSPSYINDGDYRGGFERSDIEDLLEMLDNNHTGWSAMMAPIIMGNPERPELASELEASFCRTDPMHAQHFARVTFLSDNRADLPKLRCRTLILQCDKDAIAPVSVGRYVHQCVSQSQLILMDATGHCPHLSSPGIVTQAIQRFL